MEKKINKKVAVLPHYIYCLADRLNIAGIKLVRDVE